MGSNGPPSSTNMSTLPQHPQMPLMGTALLLQLGTALLVGLLASHFTPFPVSAVLGHLPLLPFQFSLRVTASVLDFPVWERAPDLVFDYSYSLVLSEHLLASIERETVVICMYVGCPAQEMPGRLTSQQYSSQLREYMQAVHFHRPYLVAHCEGVYHEVAQRLLARQDFSGYVYVSAQASNTTVEDIIGKLFKPLGSKTAVFLVNGETAQSLLSALETFHMYTAGFAYIFTEEAAWSLHLEGVLYVTEAPTVPISSKAAYEAAILQGPLEALRNMAAELYSNAENPPNEHILKAFRERFRPFPLSLVNINSGFDGVSGSAQALGTNMLFPGKSYLLPTASLPTLAVSVDYEGLNSDGSAFPNANSLMRGYEIAYSEANSRSDLLPNHHFLNHTVSPGGQRFNNTWAITQFERNRDTLGLALHPLGLNEATIGVNQALQQLSIDIPTSSIAVSAALGSAEEYPMFYRTCSNSLQLAEEVVSFFTQFAWKHTAVIYSNSPEDTEFYAHFRNLSIDFGIEITNREQSPQLPVPFEEHQANQTIAAIFASSVRIVILASPDSGRILERMYDLGARQGDYLIWLSSDFHIGLFSGNEEKAQKRRSILAGGMMIRDRSFIGKAGERVQTLLRAEDGDSYEATGCAMYDAGMALVQAVDFMLARGMHYERGGELMRVIRSGRLVGCTGVVQIRKNSNDRIPYEFSLINVQDSASKDFLTSHPVALHSPTHPQVFTFTEPIQFPGHSPQFLDSWPKHAHCPYYTREITDFPKGRMLGILISGLFAIVSTFMTLLIWRGWWDVSISLLINRYPLSIEDVLVLICLPIEFLQTLALAPSIDINDFLRNSMRTTNLAWEDFLNITHGVYWAAEIACFILTSLYISIVFLKFLDLESKLVPCKVLSLVDLLLPAYSSVSYLPIVSTLLSSFACYRSTGAYFTASFLNRDCFERCWSGTHLKFAVCAGLLLVIYVPVAIFTRPIWQETQESLHVKILPFSLLVKTVFQSLLVAVSVALKDYYPTAHAVVYLALVLSYLFFVSLLKPYNYDR